MSAEQRCKAMMAHMATSKDERVQKVLRENPEQLLALVNAIIALAEQLEPESAESEDPAEPEEKGLAPDERAAMRARMGLPTGQSAIQRNGARVSFGVMSPRQASRHLDSLSALLDNGQNPKRG